MTEYLDMSWRGLRSAEDPIPLYMTLEEYLGSSFSPDVDFVDGRTENRNVGEYAHSCVLGEAMYRIGLREDEWNVQVLPICRLQVAAQRIRVPDVMVVRPERPSDGIVHSTPLICMEVISPDDTWRRLRGLFDDYVAMGVENVWVFEPEVRGVHRYDAGGLHRVLEPELVAFGTEIRLNVGDVFRRSNGTE